MQFKDKESKNFSVPIIRYNGIRFFFLLSLFYSVDVKKKENIDEKGGYSSVRRVVDQLEPRPWPFEDRTSTCEVMVAYVASAKFNDPLPEKSNAKHRTATGFICETRHRFFTSMLRPVEDFWRVIPDARINRSWTISMDRKGQILSSIDHSSW